MTMNKKNEINQCISLCNMILDKLDRIKTNIDSPKTSEVISEDIDIYLPISELSLTLEKIKV